jgi:Xaa-Pro aminopeptidase
VRIEDDVLITKTGYDILSIDAPKSVEDIESLMSA